MSLYVLSKVIQIEMGSPQTCYCLTIVDRLYTHSVGKTASLAVKGSAHLYLEIVRVFSLLFFFRTAVFRKLFDIRFSYKHCNFSHICLLVKMASKTMTRSIIPRLRKTRRKTS